MINEKDDKQFKGHPNLHPAINAAITFQQDKGTIDFSKLDVGVKVEVKTNNSIYTLTKRKGDNKGNCIVQSNGKYFNEPAIVYFGGSTFGGSMIMVEKIGYLMYMEIGRVTTSSIQAAKIIGKDYEYKMEW